MTATMTATTTVAQAEADLAVATSEVARLSEQIDEAQAELDKSAAPRWQLTRDRLRRSLELAQIGRKRLIDVLATAQRQALLDRRAEVLRQKAELKTLAEATAEQFRAEFLQARAALLAFAQLRDQSKTLALQEYDIEAAIAAERRPPLLAWAVVHLPLEFREWAQELVEMVEVNTRGSTA